MAVSVRERPRHVNGMFHGPDALAGVRRAPPSSRGCAADPTSGSVEA